MNCSSCWKELFATWARTAGPNQWGRRDRLHARGVRHTFQNCGTTTSKHWVLATPSGFEKFFSECAEVFALGGVPDMQRIIAIAKEHQLQFVRCSLRCSSHSGSAGRKRCRPPPVEQTFHHSVYVILLETVHSKSSINCSIESKPGSERNRASMLE